MKRWFTWVPATSNSEGFGCVFRSLGEVVKPERLRGKSFPIKSCDLSG